MSTGTGPDDLSLSLAKDEAASATKAVDVAQRDLEQGDPRDAAAAAAKVKEAAIKLVQAAKAQDDADKKLADDQAKIKADQDRKIQEEADAEAARQRAAEDAKYNSPEEVAKRAEQAKLVQEFVGSAIFAAVFVKAAEEEAKNIKTAANDKKDDPLKVELPAGFTFKSKDEDGKEIEIKLTKAATITLDKDGNIKACQCDKEDADKLNALTKLSSEDLKKAFTANDIKVELTKDKEPGKDKGKDDKGKSAGVTFELPEGFKFKNKDGEEVTLKEKATITIKDGVITDCKCHEEDEKKLKPMLEAGAKELEAGLLKKAAAAEAAVEHSHEKDKKSEDKTKPTFKELDIVNDITVNVDGQEFTVKKGTIMVRADKTDDGKSGDQKRVEIASADALKALKPDELKAVVELSKDKNDPTPAKEKEAPMGGKSVTFTTGAKEGDAKTALAHGPETRRLESQNPDALAVLKVGGSNFIGSGSVPNNGGPSQGGGLANA